MLRAYPDVLYPLSMVAASVLAATNTGTTAVDLKTCRSALLLINLTVGTDVPSSVTIQDSADNSTFADHTDIDDTELDATVLYKATLRNLKRYVRIKWTRALSNGDSYWSVELIGFGAQLNPVS